MQTLDAMAEIVREDRTDRVLRSYVLNEIVGDVRGHDSLGEVTRIFEYARDRITYRRDPFGVERVIDPWSVVHMDKPEGDCGVKSLFIASCCAVLGYKPYFVVIKQTPNQTAFNHVYNLVLVGGAMQYLDATPEDAKPGEQARSVVKKIYPIFD